ncbi:hypothetical protein [Arthrobacter sp. SD76]|uniref:hypothetical protein n=1 Tax=Arthrobacter sp. SD76 TaxID=3415007 RepID=UPI003C75932B
MIRLETESRTAYCTTTTEALHASSIDGEDRVVIEDKAEQLKMLRLLRGVKW